MLSINKIQLNHFFSEETREALILQCQFYLVAKCNFTEKQSEEIAKNHVMLVHKMLNTLINRGDIKAIDRLLDCCNNHSVRKSYLFSNMIYTFNNDKIVEKFDKHLVNKMKTKKQSEGLLNILLTNQINNKVNNDCTDVYKSLINFDENNLAMSKAKIKSALNKSKMKKDLNYDSGNINKIINNYKTEDNKKSSIADELLSFLEKSVDKIIDMTLTPIEKYIQEKILFFIEFCKVVAKELFLVAKFVGKSLKSSLEIEEELSVKARLDNKNKNKNLQRPRLVKS